MKITQPVLIHSFQDMSLTCQMKSIVLPLHQIQLYKRKDKWRVNIEFCRSDDILKWSGQTVAFDAMVETWSTECGPRNIEIYGESKQVSFQGNATHIEVLCQDTYLCPEAGEWDGKDKKSFLFKIHGKCESKHSKDEVTRRSVGGHVVYLCRAPVVMTCNTRTQGRGWAVWCSAVTNETNIWTKNTSGVIFERSILHFVGRDEYMTWKVSVLEWRTYWFPGRGSERSVGPMIDQYRETWDKFFFGGFFLIVFRFARPAKIRKTIWASCF